MGKVEVNRVKTRKTSDVSLGFHIINNFTQKRNVLFFTIFFTPFRKILKLAYQISFVAHGVRDRIIDGMVWSYPLSLSLDEITQLGIILVAVFFGFL